VSNVEITKIPTPTRARGFANAETTPVSSNENGPCTFSLRHREMHSPRPEHSLPRSLWKAHPACALQRKMPAPVAHAGDCRGARKFRDRVPPFHCRKCKCAIRGRHAALEQTPRRAAINGQRYTVHIARLFGSKKRHHRREFFRRTQASRRDQFLPSRRTLLRS